MLTLPPPISCGVAKALKVQANAVVTPATMPGIGERQRHREEDADRPGAQALGGLLVVGVDVRQRRGQHDDHQRQRHMHERDGDAGDGEQQLQRLGDDPELAAAPR